MKHVFENSWKNCLVALKPLTGVSDGFARAGVIPRRAAVGRSSVLFFSLLFCVLVSPVTAANFPFPSEATYPFAKKIATSQSETIQRIFDEWKAEYYEEKGDLARVRFDPLEDTVSEGIGYGMLIMVYMENERNQTREAFDKLYRYYQAFVDDHGLMHWRIRGFEEVVGLNSATDAELDVALALLMAYKQWGDDYYLDEAKKIIDLVFRFQVNSRGYLKPGNTWDTQKNPCYLTIAAFELFKKVDTRNNWQWVIETSYELLNDSCHPDTGLAPDWCTEEGVPISGGRGDFSYDAVRVPWRLAWTYAWFGDERALDLVERNNRWVESIGGLEMVTGGYALDGTALNEDKNATFTGTFATSAIVDPKSSLSADEAFRLTAEAAAEKYYEKSLQTLYLLFLSGNCQNFWE